ncbi:MAG TPA: tetratricopeptide repeat protein [Terriglobia bacterium]|nr:tetratricopeptide repeat protein [Terriglobia bacterium]
MPASPERAPTSCRSKSTPPHSRRVSARCCYNDGVKRSLGLLAVFLLASGLQAAPSETRTIVVVPFENESSNSDLGWISEAFAQVLSTRLAGPGRYVLDRDERTAAYEQLGIPPGTPLTLASAYKVAQTLGVDWAVVGNFRVTGEELTAGCQLLEVHNLKLTPRLETSGALADLIDIQTRLAWRLLAAHDPNFTAGAEDDFAKAFPTIRLDAYENYIRGILSADDETQLHFLNEADRLDPSNHNAAFALGRYYFEHKQYPDSAARLRKLTPADSHYLESLFLLGVDEYFIGEGNKSEAAFLELEKQVPLNEVANNLSVVEARRGDYQQALGGFNRAYQGDPLDPDYAFNAAVCLWRLKRYQEAANDLQSGLSQNQDDPEAHTLLAVVFTKVQNSEGLRRELKWLDAHGAGADPLQDFTPELRLKKRYDGRAFGLLSVMLHNTMEARLAQENPEQHGETHLSLGKRLLAEGQFHEAERELDEATSLLPGNSEAHLVLGQVYEGEGRHDEAAREFKAALEIDNNAVTHMWLAHVYLSLNQTARALDEGRAALALQPGNAEAQRLMDDIRRRTAAGRSKP